MGMGHVGMARRHATEARPGTAQALADELYAFCVGLGTSPVIFDPFGDLAEEVMYEEGRSLYMDEVMAAEGTAQYSMPHGMGYSTAQTEAQDVQSSFVDLNKLWSDHNDTTTTSAQAEPPAGMLADEDGDGVAGRLGEGLFSFGGSSSLDDDDDFGMIG